MIRHFIITGVCLISFITAPHSLRDATNPVQPSPSVFVEYHKKATISYIKRRCKETRIPERLVFNIIRIESSWKYPDVGELIGDSLVQSNRSAYGLMQVQIPTAWEMMEDSTLTEDMLMANDTLNAESGIRYLVWLRNYYRGNYYFAITAYNRGISNVDADLEKGYDPTSEYTIASTKGVFFGKTITQTMHDEMEFLREKSVEFTDK